MDKAKGRQTDRQIRIMAFNYSRNKIDGKIFTKQVNVNLV